MRKNRVAQEAVQTVAKAKTEAAAAVKAQQPLMPEIKVVQHVAITRSAVAVGKIT